MRRSVKATNDRRIAQAATTLVLLLLSGSALFAQAVSAAPTSRSTDFALSYTAEHANSVGGGGFWLQGGSAEVGISLWRGLAVTGNFTETHTASSGTQNVPLSLMVYTFGPRYRWKLPGKFSLKGRQTSVFGEAMVGGAKGFDSLFPAGASITPSASSIAIQLGAGLDIQLKKHLSLRPAEISWVRMQLPNSTSNAQSDLRISTGAVLCY
jgi:hypothetical protein